MKARITLLAVLLVILFMAGKNAFRLPNSTCVEGIVRLSSTSQFWTQTEPTKLKTQSGDSLPITYAFDAELWQVEDIANLLRPTAGHYEAMKGNLASSGQTYTISELATHLKMSEDEVRANLNPLPGHQGERYTFLDLKPSALKNLKTTPHLKSQWAYQGYELVNKSLSDRGIPVRAKFESVSGAEGSSVELVMKGSMSSPDEFRKILEGFLYKEVSRPETHFHMGFPSAAISPKQVKTIARALEMKINIDELLENLEYEPGDSFYPYDETAFGTSLEDSNGVGRGTVRISINRWKEPYQAHDMEIRNWMDLAHAKEIMHLSAELAANADKLKDTSDFSGLRVKGIMPSNLNATLRYLAYLLKDRVPPSEVEGLAKLNEYADKIEADRQLPDSLRKEIYSYVRQKGYKQYVKLDLFLKKAE